MIYRVFDKTKWSARTGRRMHFTFDFELPEHPDANIYTWTQSFENIIVERTNEFSQASNMWKVTRVAWINYLLVTKSGLMLCVCETSIFSPKPQMNHIKYKTMRFPLISNHVWTKSQKRHLPKVVIHSTIPYRRLPSANHKLCWLLSPSDPNATLVW